MAQTRIRQKNILVCLAHPDDESFGMGGTLAYYSSQGVHVHLLCATRGEAGSVDEQHLVGYADITELREAELRCAAKALGLASVNFLDYRDSGMAGSEDNQHGRALVNAALDEVAAKIVGHIRTRKPQIVLTFDSVGGYHHPDHIAIHKATIRAFHAAGDGKEFSAKGSAFAPEKLFFNSLSRRRLRFLVRLLPLFGKDPRKLGRNEDIDITRLALDEDTPPHVEINYRSVQEKKRRANACHASQLDSGGLAGLSLLSLYWRLVGRRDHFTRAYPPTEDDFRAKDLFAD